MKNLHYFLLLTVLIIIAGCETDPTEVQFSGNSVENTSIVVPHENQSLMINICATNCPPCGGWGWTMFDEVAYKTRDESLPLMIYSANPFAEHLICEEGTIIDDYLGVTGYPTFAANNEMMLSRNGGSVNVYNEKQMIYDTIASHSNSVVSAGAGLHFWMKKDGYIRFSYKMTLFDPEDNANYQLAIYVVEDKVKAYQAGHKDGIDAIHPFVLRDGYKGAWGVPFTGDNVRGASMIGGGSIPIGVDYSSGLEWDIDNIHIYTVIYNVTNPLIPSKGIKFVNASEGVRILP